MAGKESLKQTYEAALEDIERIVEQLESGELSLEDSLAVFEKGVGLTKYCYQKLDEVEKKIELLVKDKDGEVALEGVRRTARSGRRVNLAYPATLHGPVLISGSRSIVGLNAGKIFYYSFQVRDELQLGDEIIAVAIRCATRA